MKSNPLVSLIIPVYNVAPYLKRCLDSIVTQTYDNFEAIIVNDGSTDNSREIVYNYILRDDRFKLIDKENGGLSSARNAGMRVMKGEYVIFIDSDDWAETGFIKEMVDNISFYDSDFACCRLKYVNLDKNKETVYGKPYPLILLKNKAIVLDSLIVNNIHTSVWAKIYKTSFLKKNNIDFKEGIVNEDTLFTTIVSLNASKVSFVNKVLFNSLERSGSISRSSQEKLFKDMKLALDEIREYMITNSLYNNELKLYLDTRYVRGMLYNLLQSAQRLDIKKYRYMSRICMNETEYMSKLDNNLILKKKHKIMAKLSKYPIVFYSSVKILNLLGFRMH